MSNEVLSQDEIDALLEGVGSGEVTTQSETAAPDELRPYEFGTQERIVRGRLPSLEMINQRFARQFRVSLFKILRRSPELSFLGLETMKYSDYMHDLYVPTNLNLFKMKPLRGTGLLIIEPSLVYLVVDSFFGGDGRYKTRVEGRDFTPTEMRVIQILVQAVFHDMTEAWQPVVALELEYLQSELNPHLATIVSPSEMVVVSRFRVELDGEGGEVHFTLPYVAIEPIREQLCMGIQSDQNERDERWRNSMHAHVQGVELEISGILAEPRITLADLLVLQPHDVISVKCPRDIELRVEDVPRFRGEFGVNEGHHAVLIREVLDPETQSTVPILENKNG